MAAYGSHRGRLGVDLTSYHAHLAPGVTGISVPGAKTTDWGYQDRFWAVRYDCCGHLMDTLISSVIILDDEPSAGAAAGIDLDANSPHPS